MSRLKNATAHADRIELGSVTAKGPLREQELNDVE
jgi:hypothetical protein